VFNLCGGHYPVGELTEAVRRYVPDAAITVSREPIWASSPMNVDRLTRELGFVPRYTLTSGVEAYVAAVRIAQARRHPAQARGHP
jgi:nucleoside-diphosphate-sugar epimerase